MKSTNRRYQRFTSLVVVIIMVTLALSTSMSIQAQDEETVYEIAAFPSMAFAPFYMAEQLGFFEEEGLAVEVATYTDYGDLVRAMASDNYDISIGNADSAAAAVALNIDFVHSGVRLVTLNANNFGVQPGIALDEIEAVATIIGGEIWIRFAWEYLEEQGADPSTINFVTLPFADIIPNLVSGRIQGFITPKQIADIAEEQGIADILARSDGYVTLTIATSTLETMSFEDQKALWRAIIRTNEWLSDPENTEQFQQTLIDVWGDLGVPGSDMSVDAVFAAGYENAVFPTGEELWAVNQNIEQLMQTDIDFSANVRGLDLANYVTEEWLDRTALYEVLMEMGYEEPDSEGDSD